MADKFRLTRTSRIAKKLRKTSYRKATRKKVKPPVVKTVTGANIISGYTKSKMSERPEYYSGYIACHSLCGPDHLEMIYGGVKKEFGDEAASQFCQMIYEIEDLAPTAFLKTFYHFVYDGCVWEGGTPEDNIAHDGLRDGGATAFATVAMALGGRHEGLGQTEYIRREFLRKHKDEYESNGDECQYNGYSCSYDRWG